MFEGLKGPSPSQDFDGSHLRVLIVHARWNNSIIQPLVEGAKRKLLAHGVKETAVAVHSVPGSWELPIAVQSLYARSKAVDEAFDSIIAIGVLIKGDTAHFEHIAESVSRGLMRVQLDHEVPLIFGLLTVLNEEQAKQRAGLTSDGHNHGEDWGHAAVEMGWKRAYWRSACNFKS